MKMLKKILILGGLMSALSLYSLTKSNISADFVVKKKVSFSDIYFDKNNFYHLEQRPSDGRSVIVKNGKDVFNENFSARSKVHEYGGGSFFVENENIYFINQKDQEFYKISDNKDPLQITEEKDAKFTEGVFNEKLNLIFAVMEKNDGKNVKNSIVKINQNSKKVKIVKDGFDFFSNVTFSKDFKKVCFIAWNFPNMPWDGNFLISADVLPDGKFKNCKIIAGSKTESICQPKYSDNNELFFISDRDGFWNIFRMNDNEGENLTKKDAEFGSPQWIFGISNYDFIKINGVENIVCKYFSKGKEFLAFLDIETKILKNVKIFENYSSFSQIRTYENLVAFIGGDFENFTKIVKSDLENVEIVKIASLDNLDLQNISIPKFFEFPTENGKNAYLYYYPPKNENLKNNKSLPPLIVKTHGGPTSQAKCFLDLSIQYWTSRGFAFADIDYRGSAGYGREFRESLNGNWGVFDIEDVVAGAKFLVKEGLVDENRLIIKGGSAGGYTTLAALTFENYFKAGASYYGVSDLEALVKDTHKFEKQYLDMLIGKYPEEKKKYFERSPINFADNLKCPIIFFQGKDDKVVLPGQSEIFFQILKNKKIPTAYFLFDNEGHGFRHEKTIKKCLESELSFYAAVLDMKLDEKIVIEDE